MGTATTIILFMITLTFCFNLAGYPSTYSDLACALGMNKYIGVSVCASRTKICAPGVISTFLTTGCGMFGIDCSCFDFYTVLLATMATIVAIGVALAFLFPNPYTLFAPIAIFLLGFFTFPIGIFNEVSGFPIEVSGFITLFFAVAYGMAILSFIRGGGGTP